MDQKNKSKLFTFLYVFLIIALILFMIWIVFWLKGNSKDCILDPIEYFEDHAEGSRCMCFGEDNKQINIGGFKENAKSSEMVK